METTKVIDLLSRRNRYLIGFSAIFFLVFLSCVVLHLTPMSLINSSVDFAAHHYYLAAFFALIGLLFCVKNYMGNNEKINFLQRKVNQASSLLQSRTSYDEKAIQSFWLRNFGKEESEQIDKRDIEFLQFPSHDVLPGKEAQLRRDLDLQFAMKLGNNYKQKVTIYFSDRNSMKHVTTTIWFANSFNIILKRGFIIPIGSIYKVEF